MSAEPSTDVPSATSATPEGAEDWQKDYDLKAGPREPESTLLTVAMFGGLAIFAVGCYILTGW